MPVAENILTAKHFEELFSSLYERLCRSAYRILQNQHTAEDIVQEVFYTLWRKRMELNITSFEGYLVRSVYNASLNELKKSKAKDFTQIENEVFQLADTHSTPDQMMHLAETEEKINNTINNLPTACRAIYVLSRFENRSNKEIAAELSLSIKTVENQMTKALRLLRQALVNLFFLSL